MPSGNKNLLTQLELAISTRVHDLRGLPHLMHLHISKLRSRHTLDRSEVTGLGATDQTAYNATLYFNLSGSTKI